MTRVHTERRGKEREVIEEGSREPEVVATFTPSRGS